MSLPTTVDALVQALQSVGYFADRRLATAVFLALRLQRPLLLVFRACYVVGWIGLWVAPRTAP